MDFFKLCGIQGKSFLPLPVTQWSENVDYKFLLGIANNYVVINDVAERAVLLAKRLQNNLTKNSDMKDKLVNIIPELQKLINVDKKSSLCRDLQEYLNSI